MQNVYALAVFRVKPAVAATIEPFAREVELANTLAQVGKPTTGVTALNGVNPDADRREAVVQVVRVGKMSATARTALVTKATVGEVNSQDPGVLPMVLVAAVPAGADAADEVDVVDTGTDWRDRFLGSLSGTHPGDLRLILAVLREMFRAGELSFSIGRRLVVNGPGTNSVMLLSKIVDAMADAHFFKALGRVDQLETFRQQVAYYSAHAWKETPYAEYFFGESQPESVSFKSAAAPLFAYAAALKDLMPNSTFGMSIALQRDAAANASNSIAAVTEVQAFVLAYKRYVSTLTVNTLRSNLCWI